MPFHFLAISHMLLSFLVSKREEDESAAKREVEVEVEHCVCAFPLEIPSLCDIASLSLSLSLIFQPLN